MLVRTDDPIDVPEYPDYSVREALANALAHRDWSLEGAKVHVFMFDDRLEIWSPGRLPPPITLERLGYDQFSRNRLIARVLVERTHRRSRPRHPPYARGDGQPWVCRSRGPGKTASASSSPSAASLRGRRTLSRLIPSGQSRSRC